MQGISLLQDHHVAMLILANAYFVAVEFALVSIRETRVEQLLGAGSGERGGAEPAPQPG